MDLKLPESAQAVQAMVRDFARRAIAPATAAWDRDDHFPVDVFRELGALGVLGMPVPEVLGGGGSSFIDYIAAVEELAYHDAGLSCALSVHLSAHTLSIVHFGTDAQQRQYVPALAHGERIGAFALTEPDCGSDAAALKCRAERDGETYVLDGTKQWITNAKSAGLFLLFARTGTAEEGARGITAFLVEPGTPGLALGRKTHKLGMRTSETYDLVLTGCRVPAANVLGELGGGFKIAMKTLDSGRIGIAAQAVGMAQACLDEAKAFANQRVAFGQPIAKFQGIQWKIADMATRLQAARLLTYRAAWLRDQGLPHTQEGAMAKLFASRIAREASNEALQIHGGYGYTSEFPVERHYRDAKVTEIYEGTSEIQKIVISRGLLPSLAKKPSPSLVGAAGGPR